MGVVRGCAETLEQKNRSYKNCPPMQRVVRGCEVLRVADAEPMLTTSTAAAPSSSLPPLSLYLSLLYCRRALRWLLLPAASAAGCTTRAFKVTRHSACRRQQLGPDVQRSPQPRPRPPNSQHWRPHPCIPLSSPDHASRPRSHPRRRRPGRICLFRRRRHLCHAAQGGPWQRRAW